MAMINRSGNIQAWQEARKLVKMIYSEAQLEEHYEQARKTKALIGGFRHALKK